MNPTTNPFIHTQFTKSAMQPTDWPEDQGHEVAFCGRSNAGKSSAINALTGSSKMARTSKQPGRTQLLNFFEPTPGKRLVDLPGYGYAKVAKSMRAQWRAHIDAYLRGRESLSGVVLLADVRLPLQAFDLQLIEWAQNAQVPTRVLLTKADKLSRNQGMQALFRTQRQLPKSMDQVEAQLFSARDATGLDALIEQLLRWLDWDASRSQ
ncbi:MAG: ribosome biogenesis GTP-binding protein YihA/YsxC [Pseudomonadota bacterium]|nr:ribosome biogenesis GTP-binding protein YihA/YsxC [Pseudomonadota bacterium]